MERKSPFINFALKETSFVTRTVISLNKNLKDKSYEGVF